ncbi:hypothetical protein H0H93_001211, partial [Arthromyces matolae]
MRGLMLSSVRNRQSEFRILPVSVKTEKYMPPSPFMDANRDDKSHRLPADCGLDEQGCNVWRMILDAEEDALKQAQTAAYQNELIGIRVLGFFLLDFYKHAHDGYLGTAPYTRMVLETKSCLRKKDTATIYHDLQTLGLTYRNHLIRVFRSNSQSQPGSSAHVSRPSFDKVKTRIVNELGEVSQTRFGLYDGNSLSKFPELMEAQKAEGQNKVVFTQVAHIFSENAQHGDH